MSKMSPHYRKVLTFLVFILVLSFAFYFAFSPSTLAEESGGCAKVNLGGKTISTCHLECVSGTCTEVGNVGSGDNNKDGCTAVSAKCGLSKDVTGGASGESDLPGIDLTIQDVFDIIYGFACWLWSVSMILLVIFIIISGIRFMAA